jgi:hypothetical protein
MITMNRSGCVPVVTNCRLEKRFPEGEQLVEKEMEVLRRSNIMKARMFI